MGCNSGNYIGKAARGMTWNLGANSLLSKNTKNSKKRKEPINTLCEKNADLLVVKGGDTYSYQRALKG
jgi:hypothetical protein